VPNLGGGGGRRRGRKRRVAESMTEVPFLPSSDSYMRGGG
jgi:hypothetical protein